MATERGEIRIQIAAGPPSNAPRQTAPPTSNSETNRFPSLEDQKLADLVWKRLGLEMESIAEKELEPVKALGYDGGLKVSAGVAGLGHDGRGGENIQTGDILVGLHVWPTTTMKDVAAVLSRDDLAELNPLKFYVVRGSGGSPGPHFNGVVVTGRVSVIRDPKLSPPSAPSNPYSSHPVLSTPPPSSAPAAASNPYQAPTQLIPAQAEAKSGMYLYFFHSTTSQPSKEMLPIAEKVAKEFPAAQFVMVSSTGNTPLLKTYDVDALPTLLLVRNNKVIARLVGLLPEEMIRKTIEASVESVVGQTPQAPNDLYGSAGLTKENEPRTSDNTKSPHQPSSSDRIVVAYDIPEELRNVVRQHEGMAKLRGLWGEHGRFVVQATPQRHEQFKRLLDATPKWRVEFRKRHAAGASDPKLRKVEDEDVLEWPNAGLMFHHDPSIKYPGLRVVMIEPGSPAAWQDIRLGDVLGSVEGLGTGSLAELESVIKSLMASFSSDSKQVSTLFVRPSEGSGQQYRKQLPLRFQDTDGDPPHARTTPGLESRRAEAQQQAEAIRASANAQGPLGVTDKKSSNSIAKPAYSDFLANVEKENLRYDGRSFRQWRDTWQTELSIEKRVEAVKALAAFGARGYGLEAAETILDVVAEYDPRPVGKDTPEARLRTAVQEGLLAKIPTGIWRPLLRKRFNSDPLQWQWLAVTLLSSVKPVDEEDRKETQSFLLQLARSGESRVATPAVSALVKLDPALGNNQTKQLVMERLNSDELDIVRDIISDLSRTPLHPPELIDLLLHGDPQKQKLVRQALDRHTPWKANLALIDSLTAVLKDETKAADHLAAIRALAALGQAAEQAESKPVEVLQAIVNNGNAELQVAAAVTIGQITRGRIGDWPLLTGKLRDADGNDLDSPAIQQLTQIEREEVFGKDTK